MKLLICSDLHVDVNKQMTNTDIIPIFIEACKKRNPDAIIIAGDLTGNAQDSLRVIVQIKEEVKVPVYFVPGNHDIWVSGDKKTSSWDSYHLLLKDQSSLLQHEIENEHSVVIGAMSWYDYSFGPMSIYNNEFARKKKKYWADAYYAIWSQSDQSLCDQMIEQLKEKLEKHKEKNVILINHYLPYEDFITVKGSYEWNFCNAYMGSKKLGELIDSYPNISTVVFGHTHRRFGTVKDYRGKTIICNPLGYAEEWGSDDIEYEFNQTITMIEI